MASRVDKYFEDDYSLDTSPVQSRVSRNSRLYEEVCDNSGDLDNLPLEDNTKDIDIDKLKELISNVNNESDNDISNSYDESFWESKKRNIDDDKVYDINKMLEKAKYDNFKLKDSESEFKTRSNILSKLDVDDDYVVDDNDYSNTEEVIPEKDDELHMTRELKYHTKQLEVDPLIDQVMPDNDLAMDLFFDLKPTGDTIVTKPIKEKQDDIKEVDTKNIIDTSDIDIIKKDVAVDNDFFTSSYVFSNKDFSSDDDDFDALDEPKSVIKIILLVLGIVALIGLIVYFVLTYGFGA